MPKKNNIKNSDDFIGSVVVQGGGIAGVQASLDLANAGYKVYLIEKSPAVGGMMSHLDKTFPTGDCATCIVSPKLVECFRNSNIEIHTLSEIAELKGETGNFTVRIKKNPRYVDESNCTDCGECSKVCPVDISDKFNRNLNTRKAISKYYSQAIPNVSQILRLGDAPCVISCPAKINVQGYVQLIKQKEYIKAVELIRKRNPFAAVCGRVCTHPCETDCVRNEFDSSVSIRLLKKFATDQEIKMVESGLLELPKQKKPLKDSKKIAIIGAGPAGLTVADDLAKKGYSITVFEKTTKAGGMLRWGIPEYRLPENILDYEIDLILRKGVNIKYNCDIGKDITIASMQKDFDAVFIGIGAQKGINLGVKGEDYNGVFDGLNFLKQAKTNDKPKIYGHTVVIGGGDVAMDAASTALRLGSNKVSILYRRTENELPAIDIEVFHAKQEGINFSFLTSPVEFIANENNKISSIKCIKMQLSDFDESQRRRPIPIEGSEFEIDADFAITAIGSQAEKLSENLRFKNLFNEKNQIIVDDNQITQINNIFAGGDVVTGPNTAIEAIAAGKNAAQAIYNFLEKESQKINFESLLKPIEKDLLPTTIEEKLEKTKPKELAPELRIKNFNEIELGFTENEAIYEANRCLNCGLCSKCAQCIEVCEKKAINFIQDESFFEINTGAVILSPGFNEMEAAKKGEYGFTRYKNVITNVQFERMLSASGPFSGDILRISDNNKVKKIAFIQCVGSRDSVSKKDYCSSICCMATIKQAQIAKEHSLDIEISIFYIDIRAFGKDFDKYFERARNTNGINFIKSIPSRIVEMPKTKNLKLRYIATNTKLTEDEFDLVVLAVGIDPQNSSYDVKQAFPKLSLNKYGFCEFSRLNPLKTSIDGVFVAGAFQEPKDIPETVTQASGAASMAMEKLSKVRNSLTKEIKLPDQHDITDELPRIGVFVCHCGINIASVIDVKNITKSIQKLPFVTFATDSIYTCSEAALDEIKNKIIQYNLNRVVVASCTPRTHEALFRETLAEAGLNPFLFELANIRDQCSWVHSKNPNDATQKAFNIVQMSIARAKYLKPLTGETLKINQSALVIGGGLTGMTAALSLANQGFNVHLIEKNDHLGGNLMTIHYTMENDDLSDFKQDLIVQVKNHPNIKLHTNSNIKTVKGHIGNFNIALSDQTNKFEIKVGAIIVATGANRQKTNKYLYGQYKNILTQNDLEQLLYENLSENPNKNLINFDDKNIVMIQCVDMRNDAHPYCSRICCSMAMKNILKLKSQFKNSNIFVLFRDIRTYGLREAYYKDARNSGAIFIRYDKNKPPEISDNKGLIISVDCPDFPETIKIETDYVVLSTGIYASDDNNQIADMLKVPINSDGFFVEAHPKLRPVDFTTEGIFLCGLAHSPKFIDENISQAKAAAARAATVLSKPKLKVAEQVSSVNQDKCISCMTCVNSCPYNAPFVNYDKKAEIESAKCMGCGICASECPACAILLNHFETVQFNAMIDALLME